MNPLSPIAYSFDVGRHTATIGIYQTAPGHRLGHDPARPFAWTLSWSPDQSPTLTNEERATYLQKRNEALKLLADEFGVTVDLDADSFAPMH